MIEVDSRRATLSSEEIEDGKVYAILGYLFCCFAIPLAIGQNRFCRFHAEQQILILMIMMVAATMALLSFLGWFLHVAGIVLMIIGIINAAQGKCEPLPVVGKYGEKFNLMK